MTAQQPGAQGVWTREPTLNHPSNLPPMVHDGAPRPRSKENQQESTDQTHPGFPSNVQLTDETCGVNIMVLPTPSTGRSDCLLSVKLRNRHRCRDANVPRKRESSEFGWKLIEGVTLLGKITRVSGRRQGERMRTKGHQGGSGQRQVCGRTAQCSGKKQEDSGARGPNTP